MRTKLTFLLLVALVLSLCVTASARDIFVATTGNDANSGTIDSPLATLRAACLIAVAGDNINMRAGTYTQHLYWDTGGNGAPGAYITIQAYDGDRTVIYQTDQTTGDTICFHGRQYIKLIGLEVTTGANIVHADLNSQYIYIQRCYIHHGETDADCLKINQCDYVFVENNEVAFPGERKTAGYQEAIDFVDVDFSAQRDNYVHDFQDMALYSKGGSENTIIERNVISHQTSTYGNPATGFGQQTDNDLMDGATYQSYNCIYRNNIIRDSAMGALGTYDCYHGYFYHNTVHNCGDSTHGIINQRISTTSLTPRTTGAYFFNNVFLDTAGDMGTVYAYHSGIYEDLQSGYNNFYNNGNPIPSTGLINPNTETGATFGNPSLANPTGSATTWAGWKDCYRITSASTALIDRGSATAGNTPYPAVSSDMDGVARPQGSGYDIGAFEYAGGPVAPVANFTGNPTSGAAPLTVAFTDTSTGSPTSWSWAFGDGGTSTAQNPSHQYAAGAYTVSLTATNAAGSDVETKSNYITATSGGIAPVADFTGNPTSGVAPLTVAFTDTSTNTPTSWSWTFGDGGTATTQNPSHQYASAGTYTVSLTATNAYGSDVETKTGYITVSPSGGAQDYFCSSITVGVGTVTSGDHTSVHASDNVYLVVGSVKSGGKQTTKVTHWHTTGLTSLSSLSCTLEGKVNTGSQPVKIELWSYSGNYWVIVASGTATTSDTTLQATNIANPSVYLSSGTVQLRVSSGGTGSTTYSYSTDLVKITAAP